MTKNLLLALAAALLVGGFAVHFAWADPPDDFTGGVIESGALTIDLSNCAVSGGNASGQLDFTDAGGISSITTSSLSMLFIDPSTGSITVQSSLATPVILGNTATWTFSGESVPSGLEFIGVNLSGTYLRPGAGSASLSSMIAAWSSL